MPVQCSVGNRLEQLCEWSKIALAARQNGGIDGFHTRWFSRVSPLRSHIRLRLGLPWERTWECFGNLGIGPPRPTLPKKDSKDFHAEARRSFRFICRGLRVLRRRIMEAVLPVPRRSETCRLYHCLKVARFRQAAEQSFCRRSRTKMRWHFAAAQRRRR